MVKYMVRNLASFLIFLSICVMVISDYVFAQERKPGIHNFEDTLKINSDISEMLKIKVEQSEPVVFSAARQEQKISEAPATIYLITAKDIEVRGYLSLKHILQDIPEFKFDENSDPYSYNAVTVRGIRGNEKFIIMMDGVRISSPTNEQLPILENYPIRNIKQIEIITSASSAIYGADALMGIINIISYKPEEINGVKGGVYGGMYDYFSADAIFAKKIKKIQFRVAGQLAYDGQPNLPKYYHIDEYNSINSLKTGIYNTKFGLQKVITPVEPNYGASIHTYNFEAALTYRNFTFSIFQNYAATPNFMPYSSNSAVYNDSLDTKIRVTRASITYQQNFSKLSNTTIISFSDYELLPSTCYRNILSDMEPGYKYAYGSQFQVDQQNSYTLNKKLSLGMGATVQINSSLPDGDFLQTPVNPNLGLKANVRGSSFKSDFIFLQYYNIGAYGQIIYKPIPKLILIAGGRYDYNTRYQGVLNPRAGATYKITSNTTVKLFFGSAYLAPPPYVAFQRFGSFYPINGGTAYQSDFYHIPNPNLQPVRNHSLEFSFYQSLGNFKINASVYHIWMSNLYIDKIFEDSTAKIYGWPAKSFEQTIGQKIQRNYGFTINSQYKIELKSGINGLLYGGIAFTDGWDDNTLDKEDNHSVQMPFVSNWQFRLGTDWFLNKFNFSIRLIGMTDQRFEQVVETSGRDYRRSIPGYMVINASIGYRPIKALRISLLAENLTDQRYRNINAEAGLDPAQMLGVPQNPMRLIMGAQFTF